MLKHSYLAPIPVTQDERRKIIGITKEYANEAIGSAIGGFVGHSVGSTVARSLQDKKINWGALDRLAGKLVKKISSKKKAPALVNKTIYENFRKGLDKKKLGIAATALAGAAIGSIIFGKGSVRNMEEKYDLKPMDKEDLLARRTADMVLPFPLDLPAYYFISKYRRNKK
jgi:hypothetical protein